MSNIESYEIDPLVVFYVWDPLNGSRETAMGVSSGFVSDEEEAAELFAERDRDGLADGIYDHGHEIHVQRAEDGPVKVFSVQVDYEPVFHVRAYYPEVKP